MTVTYGLGANKSLPQSGDEEPGSTGTSDLWAEISGIIVKVRRSTDASGGTATGWGFF